MKIKIIPNFLTEEVCQKLNDWVNLAVKEKWLDFGKDRSLNTYTKRLNSRFYGDRFTYPEEALEISKQIRKYLSIDKFPIIDYGRDGIVVSYIMEGGDVYEHRDPKIENYVTLRCNIVTQSPENGGNLYIEGKKIDVNRGDLHCYLVSEHNHKVSKVIGNTPRILWMFGAYVPYGFWE